MAHFPETRISLILRLASSNDVQAWEEFAEIYAPALRALALRRGLQPADADDVTQDILFGVARAIERFEPDRKQARFRTWLSRIARNLIADFFAGKAKKPVSQVLSDSWMEEIEGPGNCLLDQEFEHEYRMALFRVAAKTVQPRVNEAAWQAFESTVVEGQAVADVAQRLSIQVGYLYVLRCRVLKQIRDEVTRLERCFTAEPHAMLNFEVADAPTGGREGQ